MTGHGTDSSPCQDRDIKNDPQVKAGFYIFLWICSISVFVITIFKIVSNFEFYFLLVLLSSGFLIVVS
ncbi:MAG TPA: hypothetical protein VFG24_03610, partial [Nitrosopumilaceae archaeon]|nr:hypothetical protein [Nitrosopumilaceae archaeon]